MNYRTIIAENAKLFTASSRRRNLCLPAANPKKRDMIPLNTLSNNAQEKVIAGLRIQQFNILADGLSGLRKDMGAFSRASPSFLNWSDRRRRLFVEIAQYDPDIITLQECDHFHDFFLPELEKLGYYGIFAPKPASACLEVSENSDGCAIFFRRSVFEMMSVETLTYAIRKSDVQQSLRKCRDGSAGTAPAKLNPEDTSLRSQNQVALIICGFLLPKIVPATNSANRNPLEKLSNIFQPITTPSTEKVPIVIATTHLKASKSAEGEVYRLLECRQLVQALERNMQAMQYSSQPRPALLLTGDLNATPDNRSDTFSFDCEVYNFITGQSFLPLRSILNDDLPETMQKSLKSSLEEEKKKIWTTWKARRKGSEAEELVVKHCIDYILYSPSSVSCNGDNDKNNRKIGLRARAVSALYRDEEMDASLLPSNSYPSDHISIIADFDVLEKNGQ